MARRIFAVLLVPLLLVGGLAHADDAEADRLRDQLRATVLQLRELQDQQAARVARPAAAPGADSAVLRARLAASEARLRAARRDAFDVAALKTALAKATADAAALAASAAAAQAEMVKYKAAFAQASDAAAGAGADRDSLRAQLMRETTIAQACQDKNTRLIAFAQGLLDAYDHVTLGEKLMARDPVFGFTRVRLENIAQDREDAVREARCDARRDAVPAGRPARP